MNKESFIANHKLGEPKSTTDWGVLNSITPTYLSSGEILRSPDANYMDHISEDY